MTAQAEKLKVLFLCTGNSCRSQMAEAWTRVLKGDQVEAYSAGVDPHAVDPRAVKPWLRSALIFRARPRRMLIPEHIEFEYVITLCDQAHQGCPIFPAKTRVLMWALMILPVSLPVRRRKRRRWFTTGAFAMKSRSLWKNSRKFWVNKTE